jgi:hypothetical protein
MASTTAGESPKTKYAVSSSLTLTLESVPEGMTAQTLANDESFTTNVRTSIATAFAVDVDKVTVAIRVARRLDSDADVPEEPSSGASMRLQVDYKVETMMEDTASQIESTMKDSGSRQEFANSFQTQLLQRESSSGRVIVIDKVAASEAKVEMISADEGNLASTTVTEASGNENDVYGAESPSPPSTPPSPPASPSPSGSESASTEEPSDTKMASSSTAQVAFFMKPMTCLLLALHLSPGS